MQREYSSIRTCARGPRGPGGAERQRCVSATKIGNYDEERTKVQRREGLSFDRQSEEVQMEERGGEGAALGQ